jgi:ribosome-associated protein YbcJ (S4-like RNA binding protein)
VSRKYVKTEVQVDGKTEDTRKGEKIQSQREGERREWESKAKQST